MEYYFIVNPTAGKTDQSKTILPQIQKAAQTVGVAQERCHLLVTQYKGHANDLTCDIAKTGEECFVFAVGGDGTFHEVLNGAYGYPNVSVGCIPYGSGNDFLRTFGDRSDFLDFETQLQGTSVEIDLMQTDHSVSASICSVGLDAKVAYHIPQFRRIPFCGGEIAYKLSILRCLLGKLGQTLRITLDGKSIVQDCLMVAVCNGKTYGGGFYAAPEASVTDGLLDIMIVRKINLLQIAKVISIYQKGLHLKDGIVIPSLRDIITFRRVQTVSITPCQTDDTMILNEDGECNPIGALAVSVLPKAGRIVLPKGVYV